MPTISESLAIALQYHQAGRLPQAEAIYRQILQDQPNHPDALHLLGVVAHQAGQHDLAVRYIKQAIGYNTQTPEYHNNLAEAYRAQGKLSEAVTHYRQAVALRPDYAKAYNNLGAALRNHGKLDEAARCCEKALALDPRYPEAHLNLAGILSARGNPHGAMAHYRRALELKPTSAEAYCGLGNILRAQGKLDEAVAHHRQSLALRPAFPDAHNDLAVCLQALGKLGEAEAHYQQALALQPTFALAHNNLANVLRERGKLDEAEAHYRRALALRPTFAETNVNLGVILVQLGRRDEAEAHYRRALALRPDSAEAHYNLANLLKARSDLAEAEVHYRKALEFRPTYAEVHNNLANTLRDQGRTDEAVAHYRQALALQPSLAEVHLNLGLAFREQGNLEDAVAHYRKALALRSTLAGGHLSLADVFELEGKPLEAFELYQRALALEPNDGTRLRVATILPVILGPHQDITEIRNTFDKNVTSLLQENLSIRDPVMDIGRTNFNLAYHGRNDRDLQVKMARLCAKACPSLLYTAPHCLGSRHSPRWDKIKIGFISRFFYNHSVAYTTAGIIANLSRDTFDVCVFSLGTRRNDAFSQRIHQKADRSVFLPRHLEVARQQIAAAQCDILFYADIGMDPVTYFLAFSRLAPVQCVFPGHPVTTGIPAIDYFISSEHLEPHDADGHYSERLVRLERLPVYFYRPANPMSTKTRADFGLPEDRNIYLCPQVLFKFHPDFDQVIAAILRADPRGEVVLVDSPLKYWTHLLMSRFAHSMPDVMHRIRTLPRQSTDDFLRLLTLGDVILDTLHFSGGTTSFMALAMGSPIVTLPGDYMRGRVTYACYKQMGLLDCVTHSIDDYVTLAVRLGTDPSYREHIKARILRSNHVLYEDIEPVRELERFFTGALEKL